MLDFRNLNNVTVKDAYTLPRVEDTITSLGVARFFTTLDFHAALWQIMNMVLCYVHNILTATTNVIIVNPASAI